MTTRSKRRRSSSRSRRMREMRRRRVRHTILLLLLMVILAGGVGGAFYFLKGGSLTSSVMAYSTSREFRHETTSKTSQRAEAFAEDLCVVSGDLSLDSVTLESDQEGLLFNLNEKTVLFSQGAYTRVYPASITKIMTGLLAFTYGNMDDVVTITDENVNLESGSQVVGFQAGDQVTMRELVHSLLVYSGNDAASAIATHIGGSTEQFVELMNSYAQKLGCTGTHFTNPHGLQDENHYTTPYDIYLMLREAYTYSEFTDITQLGSYTVTYTRDGLEMTTYLEATDHYLTGEASAPKGITILGGKTGTTDAAGNCLALLCQDAYGNPYVSIVMGASSKELLYQEMTSLLSNIAGA